MNISMRTLSVFTAISVAVNGFSPSANVNNVVNNNANNNANANANNVVNNNGNIQASTTLYSSTGSSTDSSKTSAPAAASPAAPASSARTPFQKTDCDDSNTPPSLSKIQSSIHSIKSGSDIRGTFLDHSRIGSILNVSSAISAANANANQNPLTPFAAFCYGAAFAKMVQIRSGKGSAVLSSLSSLSSSPQQLLSPQAQLEAHLFPSATASSASASSTLPAASLFTSSTSTPLLQTTNICIGRDPRKSGIRIADAFCRGVESVHGVEAKYTDLATTPSMFAFCRSHSLDCDGGVMVTASHLPEDKNGIKFFTRNNGGLTKPDIETLAESACAIARSWYDMGVLPQTSGYGAVYCSQFVNYMPLYMESLRAAIYAEVGGEHSQSPSQQQQQQQQQLPLDGLRIVLNAGNGAGYFFNQVLQECGADVSHSIHLTPDGTFPEKTGVPNPEYQPMMDETTDVCREWNADIGIMLDTDADRCGFIVPTDSSSNSSTENSGYEALNRNRLIALLGVIFSSTSPGCTFVTDSVTSEGLAKFLQDDLGLNHVRYLKGYANVIGKAKELTESGQALAEVAIETSGHCAMRENGYLDDGTYTAVKVIGLLARMRKQEEEGRVSIENDDTSDNDERHSLLSLISNLEELDEVKELRLEVGDGSVETTKKNFAALQSMVEKECEKRVDWTLDEENLEGIRVRIGIDDSDSGGFFMLRVSLHDPIISLQIEARSMKSAQEIIVGPLIDIIDECTTIQHLDIGVFKRYVAN